MKKKIKDLTEKQIDEICDNHPLCDKCPFESGDKGPFGCYAIYRELWEDLEIEVD